MLLIFLRDTPGSLRLPPVEQWEQRRPPSFPVLPANGSDPQGRVHTAYPAASPPSRSCRLRAATHRLRSTPPTQPAHPRRRPCRYTTTPAPTGRCSSRTSSRTRSCGSSACFFFQAEDGIRGLTVTGVQTCALPI